MAAWSRDSSAGSSIPTRQRAVWPSTGNYCRGGVAISKLLGCRGVAVLPEGMSRERFDWLARWVAEPADIVRTPGTESNVKEIYDRCKELAADPDNVILNQFSEFGNYLVHYLATGAALERVFESLRERDAGAAAPRLRVRDGLGGDDRRRRLPEGALRLADRRVRGARVPDPPLQRLRRAQHPGDRGQARPADPQRAQHRRRACGLRPCDRPARRPLRHGRRAAAPAPARRAGGRCSARCPRSASRASATCSARSRSRSTTGSGRRTCDHRRDGRRGDVRQRARDRARAVLPATGSARSTRRRSSASTCSGRRPTTSSSSAHVERERIFNLGYYTWVEQQGVSLEDFQARRDPAFWAALREAVAGWDDLIDDLNARTGVLESL